MYDSDSSDDVIPLLSELDTPKDQFSDLGKEYKTKAINDGQVRKLKKAKKAYINDQEFGKGFFDFNFINEPYVSPHYADGLKFQSVHQKYFDILDQEAAKVEIKQKTL